MPEIITPSAPNNPEEVPAPELIAATKTAEQHPIQPTIDYATLELNGNTNAVKEALDIIPNCTSDPEATKHYVDAVSSIAEHMGVDIDLSEFEDLFGYEPQYSNHDIPNSLITSESTTSQGHSSGIISTAAEMYGKRQGSVIKRK